ncbi:hypothetical protein HJC23_005950 [Cyclotella cryptica]|uniref:Kinesin motor domain-containing protein n=1 Tax=Cyclotella cryptica TaxID=29204 RepID=A0ABD3R521_9STRA|eukprot:CCRYP_000535-RA/>CCRYP_000535-RA protein AED:0.18 eAED:0.18 QI:264/1/1/1/0.83/0.71/7/2083/1413
MSRPSDGSSSTMDEDSAISRGSSFSADQFALDNQRPVTAPLAISSNRMNNPRAATAPTLSNNEQNVRVVARVRPLSHKERNEQSAECIRANSASHEILVLDEQAADGKRRFEFDSVFGPQSSQEEVYVGTAGSMIRDSIYKGFNGTILAYGQTGSGKTFTMGTDGVIASSKSNNTKDELSPPSPADGVIARAVYDLFHIRSSLPSGPERVKVEMSYLEIYNEQAIDLLSDDPSSNTLQVRDSKTEGVVVQNLKSFVVSSPADVRRLMEQASAKRATGSTLMNAVSSRSHAICTLNVTIVPLDDGGDNENVAPNEPRELMRAKLTLVDLAGSERIKKTGAEGARMKEGININKGLFVLGQVVSALSELGQMHGCGKKSSAHIPYRDSKLTRLLQDSLGGNSRTVMIACISPAESNVEESINTLRYAERTRNIKNSAVRNVISDGLSAAEAAALRKENRQLKLELAQMRDGSLLSSRMVHSLTAHSNIEEVATLKAQCSSFLAENDLLKERIKSHANDVLEASLRADKWQAKFERIVEVAKEQGMDLSGKFDTSQSEDIVSQLRCQLAECKSELLEARADAAIARATAGAIIAGKGDLASISETLSIAEDTVSEDDLDSQNEQLTNELSTVSGTIEQKEAMLQQMLKERSCRENIQVHFENSLRLLQSEVDDLSSERDQLMEQMKNDLEDNSRRKCKTAVNPVTKRLREQVKSLEERIAELRQKANEHTKSLRMKEEAEKKCSRLMAEIAQDKRRRADLQKKLKEASIEIRTEKRAAQQNAARLMKDSQKLKVELSKIKSIAEKQAAVLKRKIDESAAKEKARIELEKKLKTVERARLSSSLGRDGGEVQESRKRELESWIDREMECSIIKAQIEEHKRQLESAVAERKRLLKSQSDTVDIIQLESIEADCNSIRVVIEELEATARNSFPAFENSNPMWRFVESNTFKGLSKQDAKHVVAYIFDMCYSVKRELDSALTNYETTTKIAIDAAVAKERHMHERNIMKLKVEHGEATLNLLESTQGAVSSNIIQMIASSDDEHMKTQLGSMLEAYMERCMSTRKAFKSDLNEMKESEEGMQKIMDDVTQGISFVPATARKLKKLANYESEDDDDVEVLEESFEIEVDDSSDYEPTPTPAKRRKRVAKRPQPPDSPLFGENILDEGSLQSLTVQKLREVCKQNNLPTTGKKCDLQGRLKEKLFRPFPNTGQKVIFEEDANDIAIDTDVSYYDEKPAATENVKKQLWQDVDEDVPNASKLSPSCSHEAINPFFKSLMDVPASKSVKRDCLPSSSRPSTAPTPSTTPSKMSKSPKRKRSLDDTGDLKKTPRQSAKKHRPLGFLTSSPRTSPPLVAPLGNHNRTPVMFKHTVSTAKKRLVAHGKKQGADNTTITASVKKRTKRLMNEAVARALEQCDGILEN